MLYVGLHGLLRGLGGLGFEVCGFRVGVAHGSSGLHKWLRFEGLDTVDDINPALP